MASETDSSSAPFIQHLINTRNSDISLFLPFILGLNASSPPQETQNEDSPRDSRDRVIFINPLTQTTIVIESGSSSMGFDSLFNGAKDGQPPASKASIDAMECVEIEKREEQCVICLEDWEIGEKAKEMPCKHRFHGGCIEKWLGIHGSCPVCRYEMPVEDKDKMRDGEGNRRILVGFAFSRDVSGEGNR